MNRSLLIVEDDLDQLEVLARLFVQAGYQVVSVHHPRQALEAASIRQFQVALLDAGLPEMDGIELMRHLKRSQKAVQVIILSGDQYPQRRAKAEGAFAYFLKPCRMALLEATVESAMERSAKESPVRERPTITERIPVAR
jgi:DNA-binding response OmpR family regulator